MVYKIRLQAIVLSDTNGGRAATLTPAQLVNSVANANAVFAPAAIAFVFDPRTDWLPMADTTLNDMERVGPNWMDRPNQIADSFAGKLVVFFRHGSGPNPTGNGFGFPPDFGQPIPPAWAHEVTNVRFIAMPSTQGLVDQNPSFFAHELAHHLGLYHTHPSGGEVVAPGAATPAEAIEKLVRYVRSTTGSLSALDGDLLPDTEPDPGYTFWVAHGQSPCAAPDSILISGILDGAPYVYTLAPPRRNVMSYYACPDATFTHQQAGRMHAALAHESRRHLVDGFHTSLGEVRPGIGIGGYDLADPADRAFAFDHNHSGKLDHLALYRSGTGAFWILRNSGRVFSPVYAEGSPGNGIGGYDLADPADRAFAFDYDHSGKLDHIALYRPGKGAFWILRNSGGVFSPVYAEGSPGSGIGGYDLADPADRAFAFDFDHNGKLDHIALYRPGKGTLWILKNSGGIFSPVYSEGSPGNGIGGHDLASTDDRALAFDFDHSGKLDHILIYRPGAGTIWILGNNGGSFLPVYAQINGGIGGYDLLSGADRAFAFDYAANGKLDHLALYRPGTGTIWILRNRNGGFAPVYAKGDPGDGVPGFDLRSAADRALAFDYLSDHSMSVIALLRPGSGVAALARRT